MVAFCLEVVEKAAAVVAGLKAERARKAVVEAGRARASAVMARGADIAGGRRGVERLRERWWWWCGWWRRRRDVLMSCGCQCP